MLYSRGIPVKTDADIEGMRKSAALIAQIRDDLAKIVAPGLTTGEVDKMAGDLFKKYSCKSSSLGYRNYPGNICISVNEEVVHGIGGARKLAYGDLVKIDVCGIHEGWVADTAVTVPLGLVSHDCERLINVTKKSLLTGIQQARVGNRLGDISAAIEEVISAEGFGIVREFVGHGVGRKLHEEPQIPNYGSAGTGPRLKAGMTLAIEPMVNLGRQEVKYLDDGWTVVTVDGKPSSHFEHTVLVTEGEPEILTCGKMATSK